MNFYFVLFLPIIIQGPQIKAKMVDISKVPKLSFLLEHQICNFRSVYYMKILPDFKLL